MTQLTQPTLLTPADADHYRIQVGRYTDRWYTDPLPTCPIAEAVEPGTAWPSVTTVKKAVGQDWKYVALRRVANHLTEHPEVAQLPHDELYDRLKSVDRLGLDTDSRRGSNIHQYLEHTLRGVPTTIQPGEPGWEYLPAVHQLLNTYQPKLIAAELVCIHRDLNGAGYGGTADAVIEMEGGRWLVDWKTRSPNSQHAAYPTEAAQVAAYLNSQYVITSEDGVPRRQPPPQVDGALIISIRPDGWRVYPINLPAAHNLWLDIHHLWVTRQADKYVTQPPWPPRTPPPTSSSRYAEAAANAPTIHDLLQLHQEAVAAGVWDNTLREAFTRRKQQLLGYPADETTSTEGA